MLTSIIKRDGTKEPFIPNKVNQWATWAEGDLPHVDWSKIVLAAINDINKEECTSEELQLSLIAQCKNQRSYGYSIMAGRLQAAIFRKQIYNSEALPTVKGLHSKLVQYGLMVDLGYSDHEYSIVETFIDHKLDFTYASYQLEQSRYKYALQDFVNKKEFETPQFVYMRVAMTVMQYDKKEGYLDRLKELYLLVAHNKLNIPTPLTINGGTRMNRYASCCTYTQDDTTGSLLTGSLIASAMTASSAGIGSCFQNIRALGDPIRNGQTTHSGIRPLLASLEAGVGMFKQNGRNGAATAFIPWMHPEIFQVLVLKHPMTPVVSQIANIDYAIGMNKLLYNKASKNEDVALISSYYAPEVYDAFYDDSFETVYNKAVAEGRFVKMVSARSLVDLANRQVVETRQYVYHPEHMNSHTPFKQRILQSNLCMEIALHTYPYTSPMELYSTDGIREDSSDIKGEIGLCTLAGVIVSNIVDDQEYAKVAYYALLVIDYCIDHSDYLFPHLEFTAKARRSAGVGILGLAQLLAKNNLKYSSQEGRDFIHELAETHSWHLINASLKRGKELGNCTWSHKAKWMDGWLPIDTYKKTIDSCVTVGNKRDWESLRSRIIENKGIRNTTLVAHMPGESSCLGSGTTNGVYPIRNLYSVKGSGSTSIFFVVPHSEDYVYEDAFSIPQIAMVQVYGILQKYTDQSISADFYLDQRSGSISYDDLFELSRDRFKYGVKTSYYVRSKLPEYDSNGKVIHHTPYVQHLTSVNIKSTEIEIDSGCAGGSCTL